MACQWKSLSLTVPPIYVLSKLPKMTEILIKSTGNFMKFKNFPDIETITSDSELTLNQIEILQDVEIAICDPNIIVKTYQHMKNLRWAHSTFAGVDTLVRAMPAKPSVTITRHSGKPFSGLMAEYVVGQILNVERKFKTSWINQATKNWLSPDIFYESRSLKDLIIGILGVGNMGSEVAQFLNSRGSKVIGFARRSRTPEDYGCFNKISDKLDEVLENCDYLVNTLPSTPFTHRMLNSEILRKCIKHPVFINVGRGDIISEADLVQCLKNNTFSAAVLDVFETEPLPQSSELWSMPQVIITPHVSALSRTEDVTDEFLRILLSYDKTKKYDNIVDWSAGY